MVRIIFKIIFKKLKLVKIFFCNQNDFNKLLQKNILKNSHNWYQNPINKNNIYKFVLKT